jgi:hypothetical protein
MLTRLEVFPHATGVAVGTLLDNAFHAPKAFYWAKHKHRWYHMDTHVTEKLEQ